MFKVIFSIAILLVFCTSVNAGGPVIPDGFRRLSDDELSSTFRDEDPSRYDLVVSDLNGDNLVDGASLSIDEKKNKLVLWAFLAENAGNSFEWVKLDEVQVEAIQYMGIRSITPNTITEYYPDIRGEERKGILLPYYAIEFFANEGASSVFYWDSTADQFKRIWIKK